MFVYVYIITQPSKTEEAQNSCVKHKMSNSNSNLINNKNIYGLLTTCEVKNWLDIGQVLFLHVYGQDRVKVP